MKRKEVGEFLYRFYKKRSTSFLANIYKASITSDTKDIHRARLDMKKIYALYDLFVLLVPGKFDHEEGISEFRPLYRQAGRIREIQVNFLLLGELEPNDEVYPAFRHWLRESERKAIRRFVSRVKKLDEKKVRQIEKQIGAICHDSKSIKTRSKTETFLRHKAMVVKRLLENDPGEKEIHRIRQNLKAMSAIATLVFSISERKQLDAVISALNKTEVMIGNWHDRVVLLNSIELFLTENPENSTEETESLNRLRETLVRQKDNLIEHFMPEVAVAVETVLT